MITETKALAELTAEDVMAHDIVLLPENMPLRDAARMLLDNHIGGAPVINDMGQCIGVLSAIDFLRLAQKRSEANDNPMAPPSPVACNFQTRHRRADGREEILCTLTAGVCPLQVRETGPDGNDRLVCSQPNTFLMDWQVVETEKLPMDEVGNFMSHDPVIAQPTTTIRELARTMIHAHIHRIIVVDAMRRPIGIVTSSDLLSALAAD